MRSLDVSVMFCFLLGFWPIVGGGRAVWQPFHPACSYLMKISDAFRGGVNVKSIGIVLVFCGFGVFSPLDFFHIT